MTNINTRELEVVLYDKSWTLIGSLASYPPFLIKHYIARYPCIYCREHNYFSAGGR